ncbi:hypothetical protein D9757_004390 [Collybiopsis confluens]|uniref:Uncharacterized protein n=1 Tax=Collybiopsis confluens TaxID=2823264 RepID=A0A8H5HTX0_9AGAR|nr:hypothetical protein D9757_004390 [Collybiopsis confluens]
MSTPPSSSIRRKPRVTYLSPSSSSPLSGDLYLPRAPSASTSPATSASSSTSSVSLSLSKRSVRPPLPLYHPFGELAMSVPPLNPATLGISLPSIRPAKRSGVKLRDAAVETDPIPPVPSVSTVATIAAREIKDKPSPRKKRAAGGARKRNRNDDGDDATYPAKRARQPRAGAAPIEYEPESSETSPNAVQSLEGSATPAESLAERRTTRSRGAISRRDSTASESPSVTAQKDVPPELPREIVPARSTSKEEGEVSEESKSA